MKLINLFATVRSTLLFCLIAHACSGQELTIEDLKQQADSGDAAAQVEMGILYYGGEGVRQNYGTAEFYFKLASEQGDATAQNNLGWMYLNGLGVVKDYAKAEEYFTMAAEQGLMLAQANLGSMFAEETDIKDRVKGHMWLSIAAANGNKASGKKAWVMEVMMSKEQVAEAKRLAEEWLAAHKKEDPEQ